LHIPAQDAWRADRIELMDERMSFSPWHALAAHRPLGGIMRVRQAVYAAGTRFRTDYNHRTPAEPRSAADLPA
ncbi:MAG: catalase, partial [Bradyrhizobiaceae bacterium]|nr:catalase [Bradyrhizobiaceae bacterium]